MTTLALAIWQHALRARGADVFTITRRLERAGLVVDPASVSQACRELVRESRADKSPFGYRARQARQLELGSAAEVRP